MQHGIDQAFDQAWPLPAGDTAPGHEEMHNEEMHKEEMHTAAAAAGNGAGPAASAATPTTTSSSSVHQAEEHSDVAASHSVSTANTSTSTTGNASNASNSSNASNASNSSSTSSTSNSASTDDEDLPTLTMHLERLRRQESLLRRTKGAADKIRAIEMEKGELKARIKQA
jgi:hypothetical protein